MHVTSKPPQVRLVLWGRDDDTKDCDHDHDFTEDDGDENVCWRQQNSIMQKNTRLNICDPGIRHPHRHHYGICPKCWWFAPIPTLHAQHKSSRLLPHSNSEPPHTSGKQDIPSTMMLTLPIPQTASRPLVREKSPPTMMIKPRPSLETLTPKSGGRELTNHDDKTTDPKQTHTPTQLHLIYQTMMI